MTRPGVTATGRAPSTEQVEGNQRRLTRFVELLAVLPPLAMLIEVARAPRLQFTDYWYVLLRITNPDGSLHIPGLSILHNEHPLAIPALLYWLDARLADGDNRVLGVAVIGIAAGTLLGLRAALPSSMPALARACIIVATSALIFSLHGTHNFVRAMSGSAWLTANLLVVAALLLASRGRWWPAWLLGIFASISYGTGFAVWPALALMATLQRQPWWRRILPLGMGAVIVGVWTMMKPTVDPGGTPASDPGTLLYTLLTIIGHLWTATDSGAAVFAGAVMLACYALLVATPLTRAPELRFWWALACYALVASVMIAAARLDFGTEFGLSSRYTSLSVLMTVPAGVLAAHVLFAALPAVAVARKTVTAGTAAVTVGLLGFTLGAPTAATIREENAGHSLRGVALRIGQGNVYGAALPPEEHLVPLLRSLRHYPFSDAFTLGCDGPEVGTVLDTEAMTPLAPADSRNPRRAAGSIDKIEERYSASLITGWATDPDDPVLCAVVTDGDGTITGGGISRLPRPDVTRQLAGISPNVGFSAIAPTASINRLVVIFTSGTMRWLDANEGDWS